MRSRGTPPIQRGPLANTAPVWKRSWVAVARAEEVPDNTPVQVLVAGDAWVLTRMDGMLTAFEDRCPHQRSPLSAGSVTRAADGTPRLSCAYHGWRFDGTGRCDLMPGRGKWARFGQRSTLRPAHGVAERYGLIWLAAREPLAPLPEFPEWAGDAGDRARSRTVRTQASVGQLIEGFLDGAHFPFDRAGSGAQAAAAPHAGPPGAGRVATDGWRVTGVFTAAHQAGGEADPHRVITTAGPHATAHVRLELASVTIGILLTCQPEDWGSTRVFTLITRGAPAGDATRRERFLEQRALLLLEDLAIPPGPAAAPPPLEDHGAEAGADRLSVAWRRLMTRAVYDQRHGV